MVSPQALYAEGILLGELTRDYLFKCLSDKGFMVLDDKK